MDQHTPSGGESTLGFPPFFTPSSSFNLKPVADWNDHGLWLPSSSKANPNNNDVPAGVPQDNQGNPLLEVGHPFAGIDISFEEKEEMRRSKRRDADHRRKDALGRPGLRVDQEDCWRIGHDSSWEEPEGTSNSNYDQSIPPFSRLLDATRDFLYSRHAEFQYNRNKRLFDLLRNALGLKSSFPGNHWPGSGPDAAEYIAPKSLDRAQPASRTSPSDEQETHVHQTIDTEVCVFLRKPETSVRGLLALARRETEGGWDFAPAQKFTVIAAAFMSFLVHHDVLPEPALKSALIRACEIARSAPQALLDAKALEDSVSLGTSWNRANWTLYGGEWGGAERGGLEKETITWGEQNMRATSIESSAGENEKADDGGWYVEPIVDNRPFPLTKDQVHPHLVPLMKPLDINEICLNHYMPYSRRRITAILPPLEANLAIPVYATRCHRLVTVPAPWTSEEKWRVSRPRFDDEGSDNDENDATPAETSLPLDAEKATIDEPEELIIWVESSIFSKEPGLAERLVGAGLRGRWGLMGTTNGSQGDHTQWWAFKAKDYILPAFWCQSTGTTT